MKSFLDGLGMVPKGSLGFRRRLWNEDEKCHLENWVHPIA